MTTQQCLITDNDEAAYKEEVRELALWWQDNNLSLNVSKTKVLIVDCRTRRAEQIPINIDGAVMEWFLSFHITSELSWYKHTKTVVKKAQQNLSPSGHRKYLAWVSRSSKCYKAAPSKES